MGEGGVCVSREVWDGKCQQVWATAWPLGGVGEQ